MTRLSLGHRLDEYTLYGATDKGVVRWNMDFTSRGRREILELAVDI